MRCTYHCGLRYLRPVSRLISYLHPYSSNGMGASPSTIISMLTCSFMTIPCLRQQVRLRRSSFCMLGLQLSQYARVAFLFIHSAARVWHLEQTPCPAYDAALPSNRAGLYGTRFMVLLPLVQFRTIVALTGEVNHSVVIKSHPVMNLSRCLRLVLLAA